MVAPASPSTGQKYVDPAKNPLNRPYRPYGAALELFYAQDPEVLICGPAGTGKSRAVLEKLHFCACKYAGMRGLMVRKTRESLTQSAVVTYQKLVLPPNDTVKFRTSEQEYRYPNGSVIVLGGMDKPSKVMSSEYDIIYAQEATELNEEDLEALTTRARYGVIPYNQVIMDCNPAGPYHWLRLRANSKRLRYIQSVFEDNPKLYDQDRKEFNKYGLDYLSKLDGLTGVRKKRLRYGLWAAAEGMIYDEWDPKYHMVPHFTPPRSWERIWVVDFGFTAPFVWQAWAHDKDNDILYRFAEIYQTKLLVEDAAAMINAWRSANHEPYPSALVCDWDAEDRATLERHLNGVPSIAASKGIGAGIQLVKERLKIRPIIDRPRICFMYDSLLERDPDLEEAKKPCESVEEIEGYEWSDRKKQDAPKAGDDHGMDTMRYLANYIENQYGSWSMGMARR